MRFLVFFCVLISFASFTQKADNQRLFQLWKQTASDKSLDIEQRTSAYTNIIHKTKNQSDTIIIDAYQKLSQLARNHERYDDAIAYYDTVLKKFAKMDFLEAKTIEIERASLYTDNGDSEKTMSEYFRILRAKKSY